MLALIRARVAGVTLVSVDRSTLAEELWAYGEDELYLAALDLSDEEMVRIWRLAGRLYMDERASSAGQQLPSRPCPSWRVAGAHSYASVAARNVVVCTSRRPLKNV